MRYSFSVHYYWLWLINSLISERWHQVYFSSCTWEKSTSSVVSSLLEGYLTVFILASSFIWSDEVSSCHICIKLWIINRTFLNLLCSVIIKEWSFILHNTIYLLSSRNLGYYNIWMAEPHKQNCPCLFVWFFSVCPIMWILLTVTCCSNILMITLFRAVDTNTY